MINLLILNIKVTEMHRGNGKKNLNGLIVVKNCLHFCFIIVCLVYSVFFPCEICVICREIITVDVKSMLLRA